jgi:hypothetical protein
LTPLTSDRGRIVPPNLDDRTWQELVEEVRGLIPKYAPQWTDHNPSDLGFTLVELFAYLVEGLAYRLNRVPERNYVAFLNLLGITREPPTAAQTFLTFTAAPTAAGPVPVPQGKQVQGPAGEGQMPVVFETDEPVSVLPVNLKKALLVKPAGTYSDMSSSLTASPADGLNIPVPASPDSVQLCLGFDRTTALPITLRIQLLTPVPLTDPNPPPFGKPQAVVEWRYSTTSPPFVSTPTPGTPGWPPVPNFPPAAPDPMVPVAGLQRDGTVRLTVPGDWASQAPKQSWTGFNPEAHTSEVKDNLFWLGIRIVNQKIGNQVLPPFTAGIDYLLLNSASARNALTIPTPEQLGTSTGQPNQTFALKNRPLFRWPGHADPYDHLQVMVNGETWLRADELPPGDAKVYVLNPVTGEVNFGSFDPTTPRGKAGHGTIPPSGAAVVAATYRYVAGGASGNVGAGVLGNLRSATPGIIGVTNLFSAYDGSDEEPIEDAMRRAPERLRNKDRAVAAADFEFLAREASSTDVSIVRCLEPRLQDADDTASPPAWKKGDPWTFAGIDRSPGNVNVIIVPDQGTYVPMPAPTQDQIFVIADYLDRRRDVTARLRVLGPRYLPILVVAEVHVFQTAIDAGKVTGTKAVESDTLQKILAFLHPTRGGPAGLGWQVGQHVYLTDLFRAIMPAPEIGYIASLTVQAATPPYFDPTAPPNAKQRPFDLGKPAASVRLADYELVCSVQDTGDPMKYHQIKAVAES